MRTPPLPTAVKTAISLLNNNGHRADIVGGCVRDFLLGREAYDYDVTTSASPDEMLEIFKDFRTVQTGIKHGTLTVIIDSYPLEITTYRRDGSYKDHRHPETVEFTRALEDDLMRRDFTVNAICYNETDGYTDAFGGIDDLRRRTVRAVGDARRRFDEDALRIMRAVRFAATLGFEIEENTAAAANEMCALLDHVSGERIFVEWKKLIAGNFSYPVLEKYGKIICTAIAIPPYTLPPEHLFDGADAYSRTLAIVATTASPLQSFLKMCARLRVDNNFKRVGAAVLEALDFPVTTTKEMTLMLSKLGEEAARTLISVRTALGTLEPTAAEILDEILKSKAPYRISDLAINGADLLSMGIKGKDVGTALSGLLLQVIGGDVKNEREELLKSLKFHTPKD